MPSAKAYPGHAQKPRNLPPDQHPTYSYAKPVSKRIICSPVLTHLCVSPSFLFIPAESIQYAPCQAAPGYSPARLPGHRPRAACQQSSIQAARPCGDATPYPCTTSTIAQPHLAEIACNKHSLRLEQFTMNPPRFHPVNQRCRRGDPLLTKRALCTQLKLFACPQRQVA